MVAVAFDVDVNSVAESSHEVLQDLFVSRTSVLIKSALERRML
jgi:hypothetical protein